MVHKALILTGFFILIIGIIGYVYPFFGERYTADYVLQLCSTDIGSIGQLLSQDAREVCGLADLVVKLTYAFMGVGVLMTIIGAIIRK